MSARRRRGELGRGRAGQVEGVAGRDVAGLDELLGDDLAQAVAQALFGEAELAEVLAAGTGGGVLPRELGGPLTERLQQGGGARGGQPSADLEAAIEAVRLEVGGHDHRAGVAHDRLGVQFVMGVDPGARGGERGDGGGDGGAGARQHVDLDLAPGGVDQRGDHGVVRVEAVAADPDLLARAADELEDRVAQAALALRRRADEVGAGDGRARGRLVDAGESVARDQLALGLLPERPGEPGGEVLRGLSFEPDAELDRVDERTVEVGGRQPRLRGGLRIDDEELGVEVVSGAQEDLAGEVGEQALVFVAHPGLEAVVLVEQAGDALLGGGEHVDADAAGDGGDQGVGEPAIREQEGGEQDDLARAGDGVEQGLAELALGAGPPQARAGGLEAIRRGRAAAQPARREGFGAEVEDFGAGNRVDHGHHQRPRSAGARR